MGNEHENVGKTKPPGRGNTAPRAATSPGALDWRERGGRFSLSWGGRGEGGPAARGACYVRGIRYAPNMTTEFLRGCGALSRRTTGRAGLVAAGLVFCLAGTVSAADGTP